MKKCQGFAVKMKHIMLILNVTGQKAKKIGSMVVPQHSFKNAMQSFYNNNNNNNTQVAAIALGP